MRAIAATSSPDPSWPGRARGSVRKGWQTQREAHSSWASSAWSDGDERDVDLNRGGWLSPGVLPDPNSSVRTARRQADGPMVAAVSAMRRPPGENQRTRRIPMRINRLAFQVLAVVLLVAPTSFAQYTKVKTIFLKNIQDLWDPLQSQERDKVLETARELARTADNMTGHCTYGKDLLHDGKDKILNAQQAVKQQAESVRDRAKALISTIESGGGPRDDVHKTLDEIEKLTSLVETYMQVVEDTRQWFGEERKRVVALDAELAGRAVTENNLIESAESKTEQLFNVW